MAVYWKIGIWYSVTIRHAIYLASW